MDHGDKLYVSAIIAAAGKSRRMGASGNKQFVIIGGSSVLARSVGAFVNCDMISEIIVVVGKEDVCYCEEELLRAFGSTKIKAVVAGGIERQDSVSRGLTGAFVGADIVVVHDGARPFVKGELIESSIRDAYEFGASCVAVPASDTVKEAETNGDFVGRTPERGLLWYAQTPQAFRREIIMEAYNKAGEDGFKGTDDASLAERLGYKVKLTMGSYDNIKITTNEDLLLARFIAEQGERI